MISFYIIVATRTHTHTHTHCTNKVDTHVMDQVVLTSHLRITECPHVAPVPFASPTGEADEAKGEVTGCGVRSARPHLTPRLDQCLHHTSVPGEGKGGRWWGGGDGITRLELLNLHSFSSFCYLCLERSTLTPNPPSLHTHTAITNTPMVHPFIHSSHAFI